MYFMYFTECYSFNSFGSKVKMFSSTNKPISLFIRKEKSLGSFNKKSFSFQN